MRFSECNFDERNSPARALYVLLGVIVLIANGGHLFADTRSAIRMHVAPTRPGDAGAAEFRFEPVPPLTDEQRASIWSRIVRNRNHLHSVGALPSPSPDPGPNLVAGGWPLRAGPGMTDPGYHGISAFVDHDPNAPGALLDWNCGTRSYDTSSGYNHSGTDFFTWPFAWIKMDQDAVEIVAIADGVIVGKDDGNFDRSCGSGGMWNAVYVEHADGSVAWYGHMKSGSLTTKDVGETVIAGEYLGVVGSSGNSSGPHLHLEIYDSQNNLIDPWKGPCNSTNPDSWWADQRDYYDSGILKLTTGTAGPDFSPPCPNPAIPYTEDYFTPGETVYFVRYYRDQLAGQPSKVTIFRPDDSVFDTWTDSSTTPHWNVSYWWYSNWIGPSEPTGTWRFVVEYELVTYEHEFYLVDPLWLLRNKSLTSIDPLSLDLAEIFVGSGEVSLDLYGGNGIPDEGEGDDDDAYMGNFTGGEDPDVLILNDLNNPLVFYQVSDITSPIRLTKTGTGTIEIVY